MKHSSLLSKVSGAALAAVASLAFLTTGAQAQSDYYFDPSLDADAGLGSYSGTGSGGTGIWDTEVTPDWYSPNTGSFDTTFPSYADGPGIADFDGSPVAGTYDVEVTGTVQPISMTFASSGTVTVDSVPGTPAMGPVPAVPDGNIDDILAPTNVYNKAELIQLNSGSATINAPIYVDQSAGAGNSSIDDYNGNSTNAGAYIDNNSTGTLKLTGAITFGGSSNGQYEGFDVRNTGGGSVLWDSSVTTTNTVPIVVNGAPQANQPFTLAFDAPTATAISGEFDGDIRGASSGSFAGFTQNDVLLASSGTLLLDNNNFDNLHVNAGASALTNGAITIDAIVSGLAGTIGGHTADTSTFSGTIGINSGSYTLTAAAGGKVNFTGTLVGSGITITGPGVVDISSDNSGLDVYGSYDYESGYRGAGYLGGGPVDGYDHYTASTDSNSDVGTVIQSGTTIISNTTGSAFGAGANQPRLNSAANGGPVASAGVNNLVDLDAGAALGGTGYSQQEIIAMDHTSVITPGEMAQDGTSSIGTLHLDNGLSAASGLTGNFQLGPTSNDMVELSTTSTFQFTYYNGSELQTVTADINGAPAFAFTLTGPVTINLSGTIDPTKTYTLFYSATGTAWDITNNQSDYTFTGAPAGYTAMEEYVADDMSNGEEELNVVFTSNAAAIPEPSTWALMGLGALVLIGSGKLRKLRA